MAATTAANTGFLYSLPPSLFEGIRLEGEAAAVAARSSDAADGAAAAAAVSSSSGGAAAAAAGAGGITSSSSAAATSSGGSAPKPVWSEAGATCIACGIGVAGPGFASAAEQRAHFKTDWHRYNARRRAARRPPVTEEQFGRAVEAGGDDVSSISGSDADSDSDDDESGGSGSDGEGRGGGGGGSGDEDGGGGGGGGGAAARRRKRREGGDGSGRAPQLVFETADGAARLAVWRCLLYADHHPKARAPDAAAALLPELRRLRASPGPWAVLLLRGGHFAGAVFRMRPAWPPAKGQHAGEPFEVAAHKTFHRYVVRCDGASS